jgi:hypothetical protein
MYVLLVQMDILPEHRDAFEDAYWHKETMACKFRRTYPCLVSLAMGRDHDEGAE